MISEDTSNVASKSGSNISAIRADITPLIIHAPAILKTVSVSIIVLLNAVTPKTQATSHNPITTPVLTIFERVRMRHIALAATVVTMMPVINTVRLCSAIRQVASAVHVPIAMAILPFVRMVVSMDAVANGRRNCAMAGGIMPVDKHRWYISLLLMIERNAIKDSMRISLLCFIIFGWIIFRNTPVASNVIKRKIPSPAIFKKGFNSSEGVSVIILSALMVKSVISHRAIVIRIPIPGFSGKGVRRTLTFLACRSLDFVFLVLTFDTSC